MSRKVEAYLVQVEASTATNVGLASRNLVRAVLVAESLANV